MRRQFLLAAALFCAAAQPNIAPAQDTRSYHCEITPAPGRNSKKTPRAIEFAVDFYSGRAEVTMPGISGRKAQTVDGRIKRDTDQLFSVTWRAVVELGYYSKTSVLGHRISVSKSNGSGQYRSETVRGRGNLSGKAACTAK